MTPLHVWCMMLVSSRLENNQVIMSGLSPSGGVLQQQEGFDHRVLNDFFQSSYEPEGKPGGAR